MSRAAKSVTATLPFQLALIGARSGTSTATLALRGERARGQRHVDARLDVGPTVTRSSPDTSTCPGERHRIGRERTVPRDASVLDPRARAWTSSTCSARVRIVRGREREVADRELHDRLGHTILDVDRRSLDRRTSRTPASTFARPCRGAGRFGRLHEARRRRSTRCARGQASSPSRLCSCADLHAAHGEVEIDAVRRDDGQAPERLRDYRGRRA